jgi:hypothetical protein
MTQNLKLEIDMLSPLSLTPSFGFGDRLGWLLRVTLPSSSRRFEGTFRKTFSIIEVECRR